MRLTLCQGLVGLLAALAMGCGDGASGGSPLPGSAPADPSTDDCTEFEGTFSAIQEVVFEKRGCTAQVCHGASAIADLDLRAGVSYENLVEAPSSGTSGRRVVPGDRERSVLYAKLAAATIPGSVQISGAPMPSGMPPISLDELEAIQKWINAGAPATGTVEGTQTLLDACLPTPEPISIIPLSAPDPNKGVQFRLPPIELPAGSEREVCFATYYDFTGRIPERFLDPTGRFFRIAAQELRQDPVSHHLVASHPGLTVEDVDDPSFGAWTCAGGESHGEACDPLDRESCGSGICRSTPTDSFACIGFGPDSVRGVPTQSRNIGGGQEPQIFQSLRPGVFGQVPIEGIAFWNSHALNPTQNDHVLNGRLNLYFAEEQRFPVVVLLGIDGVFAPDAAPFTEETYCRDYTMPRGARLFSMTSHYHKRGVRFWANLADGTQIYENFLYADPTRTAFDPPLAFDAEDPRERRIEYCATFNNGQNPDGSPNVETVTRLSRIPENSGNGFIPAGCTPTACVAGRIDASCGVDADCDSSPDANDGWCDACPLIGGETTEHEMFILIGQFHMAEGYPQPDADDIVGVGF